MDGPRRAQEHEELDEPQNPFCSIFWVPAREDGTETTAASRKAPQTRLPPAVPQFPYLGQLLATPGWLQPAAAPLQFLSPKERGGPADTTPRYLHPAGTGTSPQCPACSIGLRPGSRPRPPCDGRAGGAQAGDTRVVALGWGHGGGDRKPKHRCPPALARCGASWLQEQSFLSPPQPDSCWRDPPDTPGGTDRGAGAGGVCLQTKENRHTGLLPTGEKTMSYRERKTPPYARQGEEEEKVVPCKGERKRDKAGAVESGGDGSRAG
ncbi:uncharacterized protein LOC130255214 [Oenanthe melanoleuca]|uniref:uncharacterized protein LOC130255214 n=1 Tax=Oenanthe melanoleuca TaxID=2939378 RepID=UPI0024C0F7A6|nr:uncharacterized protein LOC130255214 [Oenanthe melanoleuca]